MINCVFLKWYVSVFSLIYIIGNVIWFLKVLKIWLNSIDNVRKVYLFYILEYMVLFGSCNFK